jgi:hypothetical protein
MSIAFICRIATTQDAAASPSIIVTAAAVAAVPASVMAAEREGLASVL